MRIRRTKILLHLPIAAVVVIMGVFYMATCPLDLSWEHYSQDTGDLITAAHTLGIAHPTGYPLFTLLGHLFTRLDLGIFSGEPVPWNNSAFKITLFVILTSLANLYILWGIHSRLQRKLNMRIAGTLLGSVAAAFGTMALGTSFLYWSQSIVPEVYILNLFFVNLALLIMLGLMSQGSAPPKPWLWFSLGLAMASGLFHHLSFVLFMPGLFLLAMLCLRIPNRKEAFLFVGGLLIAMLPLLYLPIRSLQNPPLDTGNPETWSNFWHHITARAYRDYAFGRPIGEMWNQLNFFDLSEQFGKTGVAMICLGIMGSFIRRVRQPRAYLAFCLISTGMILLHATGYKVMDREVFFLPGFFAMAHLLALGISFLVNYTRRTVRLRRFERLRFVIIALLIIGALFWQFHMIEHAYEWRIDVSDSFNAKAYGSKAFAVLDEDAIIFTWFDGASFSLIYHRNVLFAGLRDDVDIVFLPRIQAYWWWENVADGHPDIDMSIPYTGDRIAIIDDIITANIANRPIYTAWVMMPIPEGYVVIKIGNIFRILTDDEFQKMAAESHVEAMIPPLLYRD